MDLEIRNKRFLSLDVFRGIAILGVVVVHALIFGIFSTIDTALNILPLPMLIILSPVVIFAPMAGLFVFISSVFDSNGNSADFDYRTCSADSSFYFPFTVQSFQYFDVSSRHDD